MNTSQITPDAPTTPLTPEDLALVEALEENRFNIRLLVNKIDPLHPCQRSIITLTRWARQPHIDAAIEEILAAHRALSAKADAHAHLVARESLTHALAVAASMIPHFDTCPEDPEQAEAFSRHTETLIRETRLIARTLLKLSPPPTPPRPSRAKSPNDTNTADTIGTDTTDSPTDAPNRTDDSSSPDSKPTSSRLTRTRLNRNSRKPAFSPAEVAEILSALLDHEADLQSRAARQLHDTNSIPNPNSAHHSTTPPTPLSQDTSLPSDSANP